MSSLKCACLTIVALLAATTAFAEDESGKIVLGKLGQAVEVAKIYKAPTTKSTLYYTVKQYEYIVINPYSDKWLKVLLTNGKNGYVQAEQIAQLPYNVTRPRPEGTASRGDIDRALQYGFQYIGTPYKYGGNDMESGIDCSAFVKDVFAEIGVDLPRTAAEQYKVGKPVTRIEDLQPGDRLYFWDSKRGIIGHTGIFVGFRSDGGAYFIHSSASHHGVATDDLRDKMWRRLLVAARR